MSHHEIEALGVELKALQAIVRAMARSLAAQTPGGLSDMLSFLQVEANRLAIAGGGCEATAPPVLGALNVWTESLLRDTQDLGDIETADAPGRRVHFLE